MRTISLRTLAWPVLATLVCCTYALADDDKDMINAAYGHKFAEVLQDGLTIGYCQGESSPRPVPVTITLSGVGRVGNIFHCPMQPVRKGQMLVVTNVKSYRHGKLIALSVEGTPTSMTRGIGAYEHETFEVGKGVLEFKCDADCQGLISQWLKFSDTVSNIGNTASMVTVKEIKLGMTFADVERALGVPQTKVELGPKVLYKYKDLTVEFQDGKVADVR